MDSIETPEYWNKKGTTLGKERSFEEALVCFNRAIKMDRGFGLAWYKLALVNLDEGQVANAVHTSLFYFCKLFRKVTGMTFTEYVSRTRVEKAKNLLLNPNLRVSEITFVVGFQSLTHFNRVFRKLAGQSPTQYRAVLPNA